MVHFTIYWTLPSLNEYVRACRANFRAGNKMSRDAHYLCRLGMTKLAGKKIDKASNFTGSKKISDGIKIISPSPKNSFWMPFRKWEYCKMMDGRRY